MTGDPTAPRAEAVHESRLVYVLRALDDCVRERDEARAALARAEQEIAALVAAMKKAQIDVALAAGDPTNFYPTVLRQITRDLGNALPALDAAQPAAPTPADPTP